MDKQKVARELVAVAKALLADEKAAAARFPRVVLHLKKNEAKAVLETETGNTTVGGPYRRNPISLLRYVLDNAEEMLKNTNLKPEDIVIED